MLFSITSRVFPFLAIFFAVLPAFALTPAQNRLSASVELQRTFDASPLKGMELKFIVRGPHCDILNVEGDNLYTEMMEALANGTVMYGKVLPGGVNAFAFRRGFRDVVYTNRADKAFVSYGPTKFTRDAVRKLKPCSAADAAALTADASVTSPPSLPTPPPYTSLSWGTAKPGQRLYNGAYKHEATIVSVDRPAGLITVRYERTGTIEPKLLDAVAKSWYVRK